MSLTPGGVRSKESHSYLLIQNPVYHYPNNHLNNHSQPYTQSNFNLISTFSNILILNYTLLHISIFTPITTTFIIITFILITLFLLMLRLTLIFILTLTTLIIFILIFITFDSLILTLIPILIIILLSNLIQIPI